MSSLWGTRAWRRGAPAGAALQTIGWSGNCGGGGAPPTHAAGTGAAGVRGGVVQRRDGRECVRDVDVAVGQTAGLSASKLSTGAGGGAPMRQQGQGLPGCGAASSSDVTGGSVCETSTWLSDSGVECKQTERDKRGGWRRRAHAAGTGAAGCFDIWAAARHSSRTQAWCYDAAVASRAKGMAHNDLLNVIFSCGQATSTLHPGTSIQRPTARQTACGCTRT